MRPRHWGLAASFGVFVGLPGLLTGGYLWAFAVDQYESRVGFAIRTEEAGSPFELLGSLGGISSASSKDTDILYEFIQSQQMVRLLDEKLDLRGKYSRPEADPVFSLSDTSSIEQLTGFWHRMVRVYYESSTGLIELRTFAFDPVDARDIAEAVIEVSGVMINDLSTIARTDSMAYTREALDVAVTRLIAARQAITGFRLRTQIVDPTADVAGQMGLLNTLQTQLAAAMIEADMLSPEWGGTDPRIEQAARRIEVIESRIAQERSKLGMGTASGANGLAEVFGEYEKLKVDLQFAENSYIGALSVHDEAHAESQRKSRYLAAYVQPTLAESPTAPARMMIFGMTLMVAFFVWLAGVLIYYSLRDRR